MFYEKDIAKEHYYSMINKANFSCFLITCAFDNYKKLSRNEFIILTVKWKKKIKECVHLDDAGFVVNSGNIFVIVDNERKKEFLENISQVSFVKANKSSVCSEYLELRREDIGIFMF